MRNIKIFSVLMLLLMSVCGIADAQNSKEKIYQVSELQAASLADGDYYIEGYIVKVYECPPCPEDAMCKACMQPNIVVSDGKKEVSSYSDMTNDELIVYTDASNANFAVGQKYKFLLKLVNYSASSHTYNADLIGYEALQN